MGFIHSINGDGSKTEKSWKSDVTHQHIAQCQRDAE